MSGDERTHDGLGTQASAVVGTDRDTESGELVKCRLGSGRVGILVVEQGKSVRGMAAPDSGTDESALRYRLARRRDDDLDGRSLRLDA